MKAVHLNTIQELKSGKPQAQEQVFKAFYASLFRICQRYLVDYLLAEDCLMKGLMKMFQDIDSFRYENEESLFVWTRKICINECLMELRRKTNFNLVLGEQVPDIPLEESVLDKLSAKELLGLITQLPAGYRTVFNLYAIEGYSHQEIAQILGTSESTSKTQFLKARTRLQEWIKQGELYHEATGK